MSRRLLARLLLGLVGLVLLGGLTVRAADPAAPPAGSHHDGSQRHPPPADVSWSLLAGPVGVATTFAVASGVFWLTRRRRDG
jgi:hypothetical protein